MLRKEGLLLNLWLLNLWYWIKISISVRAPKFDFHSMTYQINLCSPLYDEMQDQSVNLRVIRILFGVDLLLLYLIFNLITFLLKKDINALKLEDK